MFSDSMPSNLLHLVILIVGCVLLLRKVAEMDNYQDRRVFILTAIISSPFIIIFVSFVFYVCYQPLFTDWIAE